MEQPGGFELYQKNRRQLLREAVASCGSFTSDQLERAFLTESEAHYRIWREEHRTLPAAERIGKILSHLEICLPDEVTAELINAYEENILERRPVLVPGVRETIERLSGSYRLGIISDVGFSPGRVLKQIISDAGLLDAFDSLVFSDEAGRSKPHIEVFERTSRSLSAAPSEIVHIGDLEFTDIVGAKNAGYYAIRFTGVTPMDEGEDTRADYVTEDFYHVPEIVKMLESRNE